MPQLKTPDAQALMKMLFEARPDTKKRKKKEELPAERLNAINDAVDRRMEKRLRIRAARERDRVNTLSQKGSQQ